MAGAETFRRILEREGEHVPDLGAFDVDDRDERPCGDPHGLAGLGLDDDRFGRHSYLLRRGCFVDLAEVTSLVAPDEAPHGPLAATSNEADRRCVPGTRRWCARLDTT